MSRSVEINPIKCILSEKRDFEVKRKKVDDHIHPQRVGLTDLEFLRN